MRITLDQALKTLSLQMPFSKDQLKKAYRDAARKAHPDMGGTHEKAILVNLAYEVLQKHLDSPYCFNRQDIEDARRKEQERRWREHYYNNPPQPKKKQPLSEEEKRKRNTTRQRNKFIKAWRQVHFTSLEVYKNNPNTGKEMDDFILAMSKKFEYFDWKWMHRAVYKGHISKAKMKEYKDFLLQVAYSKDIKTKAQWAKKYFELEFGKEYADKINWKNEFDIIEFNKKHGWDGVWKRVQEDAGVKQLELF
jgi:hypothetical protein